MEIIVRFFLHPSHRPKERHNSGMGVNASLVMLSISHVHVRFLSAFSPAPSPSAHNGEFQPMKKREHGRLRRSYKRKRLAVPEESVAIVSEMKPCNRVTMLKIFFLYFPPVREKKSESATSLLHLIGWGHLNNVRLRP